jgi:rubrerythrin
MNIQAESIIRNLVNDPKLHTRWLNTLSLMENCGARKIKRCEHPVFVNEIILKHAAEESRHAYYLKKQISKIEAAACPTYEDKYLVAPEQSKYYLHELDIQCSRILKQKYGETGYALKYASYLLVTYAIELRADSLYPVYQKILDEAGSKVNVKSIILEEMNHLEEMRKQLKDYSPQWENICEDIVRLEQALFEKWMKGICLSESLAVQHQA